LEGGVGVRKNFVAVRIRKQLERASEQAGFGVPISVSLAYWSHMRSNIGKDVRPEKRTEYQKDGIVGRWNGHSIFALADNPDEPLPYPQGVEILQTIIAEKRGEQKSRDDEQREISRFLEDFEFGADE
jgi:hypothetical protein